MGSFWIFIKYTEERNSLVSVYGDCAFVHTYRSADNIIVLLEHFVYYQLKGYHYPMIP